MRRLIIAVSAIGSALLLVPVAPAGASITDQTSPVYDLQQGLAVVGGAQARLVRGPGGLSADIQTTTLHGGNAYTVWWIVFNHPEHCEHPMLDELRCGFEDLHFPEFGLEGDPRIEATIVRAAGHVVGQNGEAGFGAHMRPGEQRDPVIGDELTNVEGAEVMLDVLDHGAKDPGNIPNQIHDFITAENSCNPNCLDHQLTGFPSSA